MTDPGYLTNHFDLNGRMVTFKEIAHLNPESEGGSEFEIDVLSFAKQWISGKQIFHNKTSGSTGSPKDIILKREQMETSAKSTLRLFKLNPGDTVLLCLPAKYIAGKMMIVRSLVGNLKLIVREPTGNPLEGISESIDFTAMIPLQLSRILESDEDMERLNLLRTILVGGGGIKKHIEKKCTDLGSEIYHTYGMTETATHIAIRRINGLYRSDYYKTLPGIKISTDSRNCLIVQGEVTEGKELITNDVIKLHGKTEFKWIGRIDQVINTGGIKIIPEELEEKISVILTEAGIDFNFFISGIPDERLGHKIIMAVESLEPLGNIKEIHQAINSGLSKYELPREIYTVHPFLYTQSGKIDRNATVKSINFTSPN